MNREIKFRAWHPKWKCFIYFNNLEMTHKGRYKLTADASSNISYHYWDDDAPLQQYTGVTDKNGKEVYEGDIVLGKVDGNCLNLDKDVFVVEYDEDYSAFVLTKRGGKSWNWIRNIETDGEVIGNIFENLDLSK